MRPKSEPKHAQRELFQSELEQIIDPRHPLARLGMCIDWTAFEQTLGATYHPTLGAPGILRPDGVLSRHSPRSSRFVSIELSNHFEPLTARRYSTASPVKGGENV